MAKEHMILENWHTHSISDAIKRIKANSYQSENHFCDLVEENIKLICRNIFDSKYIRHKREFELNNGVSKKLSVDFFIETSAARILIECKTPKGKAPHCPVSQMMKYIIVCENTGLKIDRYVIFTTDFNRYDHAMIKRFNLPIEEYFITNEKVFTVNN